MTPEFNADKADVELADDVAVALNGTATVNATLASNQRTLSGTVTAAAGGAALADAAVRVERRVQTQDDVRWRVVADLTTPANGTWSTTAPDGTYRLSFSRTGYLEPVVLRRLDRVRCHPCGRERQQPPGLNIALARPARSAARSPDRQGRSTTRTSPSTARSPRATSRTSDYASTSATGTWSVDSLAPGTYVVEIGATGS